ncbi:UNVERIFIED_CONTAM: hypothetical protein HHA_223610 [Hammondia hammondi]|eukprot:XP_008881746.1 hypothetical protein HHA_223610 [Hammondia hammondi]
MEAELGAQPAGPSARMLPGSSSPSPSPSSPASSRGTKRGARTLSLAWKTVEKSSMRHREEEAEDGGRSDDASDSAEALSRELPEKPEELSKMSPSDADTPSTPATRGSKTSSPSANGFAAATAASPAEPLEGCPGVSLDESLDSKATDKDLSTVDVVTLSNCRQSDASCGTFPRNGPECPATASRAAALPSRPKRPLSPNPAASDASNGGEEERRAVKPRLSGPAPASPGSCDDCGQNREREGSGPSSPFEGKDCGGTSGPGLSHVLHSHLAPAPGGGLRVRDFVDSRWMTKLCEESLKYHLLCGRYRLLVRHVIEKFRVYVQKKAEESSCGRKAKGENEALREGPERQSSQTETPHGRERRDDEAAALREKKEGGSHGHASEAAQLNSGATASVVKNEKESVSRLVKEEPGLSASDEKPTGVERAESDRAGDTDSCCSRRSMPSDDALRDRLLHPLPAPLPVSASSPLVSTPFRVPVRLILQGAMPQPQVRPEASDTFPSPAFLLPFTENVQEETLQQAVFEQLYANRDATWCRRYFWKYQNDFDVPVKTLNQMSVLLPLPLLKKLVYFHARFKKVWPVPVLAWISSSSRALSMSRWGKELDALERLGLFPSAPSRVTATNSRAGKPPGDRRSFFSSGAPAWERAAVHSGAERLRTEAAHAVGGKSVAPRRQQKILLQRRLGHSRFRPGRRGEKGTQGLRKREEEKEKATEEKESGEADEDSGDCGRKGRQAEGRAAEIQPGQEAEEEGDKRGGRDGALGMHAANGEGGEARQQGSGGGDEKVGGEEDGCELQGKDDATGEEAEAERETEEKEGHVEASEDEREKAYEEEGTDEDTRRERAEEEEEEREWRAKGFAGKAEAELVRDMAEQLWRHLEKLHSPSLAEDDANSSAGLAGTERDEDVESDSSMSPQNARLRHALASLKRSPEASDRQSYQLLEARERRAPLAVSDTSKNSSDDACPDAPLSAVLLARKRSERNFCGAASSLSQVPESSGASHALAELPVSCPTLSLAVASSRRKLSLPLQNSRVQVSLPASGSGSPACASSPVCAAACDLQAPPLFRAPGPEEAGRAVKRGPERGQKTLCAAVAPASKVTASAAQHHVLLSRLGEAVCGAGRGPSLSSLTNALFGRPAGPLVGGERAARGDTAQVHASLERRREQENLEALKKELVRHLMRERESERTTRQTPSDDSERERLRAAREQCARTVLDFLYERMAPKSEGGARGDRDRGGTPGARAAADDPRLTFGQAAVLELLKQRAGLR